MKLNHEQIILQRHSEPSIFLIHRTLDTSPYYDIYIYIYVLNCKQNVCMKLSPSLYKKSTLKRDLMETLGTMFNNNVKDKMAGL